MRRLTILSLIAFVAITLTSCLKDPGDLMLTASKTTAAVDEEITLTLSGAENYTCIQWRFVDDKYTIVAGGGQDDMSVAFKFSATGTYEVEVAVKNCKGEDDPCIGTCKDEYVSETFTIQ